MKELRGRFGYVDALRGIASLLVLFQHSMEGVLSVSLLASPLSHVIRNLCLDSMNFGRVGVATFFLISGYVIPFSFRGDIPCRGFVLSRFFRLFPAYWFSMILGIAILPSVDNATFTMQQIIANATMLQTLFKQPNILATYWTLSLELFFYALCLAAFMRGRLFSPQYQATATAVLMTAGLIAAVIKFTTQHANIPVGGIILVSVMYIGTLARQSFIDKNPIATSLLPRIVAFVLLVAPIAFYLGYSQSPKESWIAHTTGLYLGMALFFYAILRKAFTSSVTVFLGWISYSIYLVHPIMLLIALHIVGDLSWPIPIVGIPVLTALFSIFAATAIYYLIEKPSINLGHKLVRWCEIKIAQKNARSAPAMK